jgi:hypothetical protein
MCYKKEVIKGKFFMATLLSISVLSEPSATLTAGVEKGLLKPLDICSMTVTPGPRNWFQTSVSQGILYSSARKLFQAELTTASTLQLLDNATSRSTEGNGKNPEKSVGRKEGS